MVHVEISLFGLTKIVRMTREEFDALPDGFAKIVSED